MQKEQLSALMDGESFDSELLNQLSKDQDLQRHWQSYHLIRDVMRDDRSDALCFDISANVMAAIAKEPARNVVPFIAEAQPQPEQVRAMPFWHRMRPWAGYFTQASVAACVSLAVIFGVQQYNGASESNDVTESPVFNTLPIMGKASPVSLGVPSEANEVNSAGQQNMQEQRRRINAMLQDYELQRRLHASESQFEQTQPQQAGIQVPGNQTLGTQAQ